MLTLDSFYRDKTGVLNRVSSCAVCRREFNRKYREEHRDYFQEYSQKHRARLWKYHRKWKSQNTDRLQLYSAKYVKRRKEALDNCLPENKEYMQQMEQGSHCCEITGVSTNTQLDHIMPVTHGQWGNNSGNLMWLYGMLNTSKNQANVFVWLDRMTQERLNYLLPECTDMTVDQFRQKYVEVLQRKATERGLTFDQFKEQYMAEYETEEREWQK